MTFTPKHRVSRVLKDDDDDDDAAAASWRFSPFSPFFPDLLP